MDFVTKVREAGLFSGSCMVVGAVVFVLLGKKIVESTYKTFLRPAKDLKRLGKWAVVTGATDGIGKAYAFMLAKMGLNIVLISRTESKLADVKKEIEEKGYGVEIKYIVCDYSKFDQQARDAVEKGLAGLEIGTLINNVGASYRYPRFFHELPRDEIQHLMTMNIDSTIWMTDMVLKQMVERKRGTIVNLSSAAGRYTQPLLTEYAAAKSFIEKFSTSINAEYKSKGITCQCQVPFYVATKLAKMRPAFHVPTAKQYVDMAIKWVGYDDAIVSPFWVHAVGGWVLAMMPEAIATNVIMSNNAAVRKRGLAKDAKEKAGASPVKKAS